MPKKKGSEMSQSPGNQKRQEELKNMDLSGPVLKELFARMQTGESPYEEEISSVQFKDFDTHYSDETMFWLREMKKEPDNPDYNYLQEKLRGAILVDLGSGNDRTSVWFAKEFGAQAAIRVEKHYGASRCEYNPLLNQIGRIIRHSGKPIENPEWAFVRSDMLDFVARLPDDSVNYMMNGIDALVLGIEGPYHDALAREIMRTMKPGGIVFGNDFSAIWSGFAYPQDFPEKDVTVELAEHPIMTPKMLSSLAIFEKRVSSLQQPGNGQ